MYLTSLDVVAVIIALVSSCGSLIYISYRYAMLEKEHRNLMRAIKIKRMALQTTVQVQLLIILFMLRIWKVNTA